MEREREREREREGELGSKERRSTWKIVKEEGEQRGQVVKEARGRGGRRSSKKPSGGPEPVEVESSEMVLEGIYERGA
jgi:hypothetical protein